MSFKRSLVVLLIITLMSFAISMVLLTPARANEFDRQITGTWEVTVNLSDPNLPPSFLALETYSRDGGFITSNNMPFLTKVGQGEWEKKGQQYSVKAKFYKFDPNGLPAGLIIITHTITLDSESEYSGVGVAVLCELDGTCQSTGFTTQGRRLETVLN